MGGVRAKSVLFVLVCSCFHLPWQCQAVPRQAGPSDWEIPGKPVWWCGRQCHNPSPALPKPAGPKGHCHHRPCTRRGEGAIVEGTHMAALSPSPLVGQPLPGVRVHLWGGWMGLGWRDISQCWGVLRYAAGSPRCWLPSLPPPRPERLCGAALVGTSPWLFLLAVPP